MEEWGRIVVWDGGVGKGCVQVDQLRVIIACQRGAGGDQEEADQSSGGNK